MWGGNRDIQQQKINKTIYKLNIKTRNKLLRNIKKLCNILKSQIDLQISTHKSNPTLMDNNVIINWNDQLRKKINLIQGI